MIVTKHLDRTSHGFSTNSARRRSREAEMRWHLARLIRGVILRDGYSSRRYLPALATAVLSPPTSLSPIRSSLGLPAPAPQKPNRSGFAELHFRPRGSDLVRASSPPFRRAPPPQQRRCSYRACVTPCLGGSDLLDSVASTRRRGIPSHSAPLFPR